MIGRSRWPAATAMLALVAAASCGGTHDTAPPPEPRLTSLAELRVAVQRNLQRGALVSFWATWWIPCVAEMPHLVQVAAEAKARGGQVLAVSQDLFLPGSELTADQALAKVRAFATARQVPFPVYVLDDASLDPLCDAYALPGPIPVTLAFDRTGKEVDRQEGSADLERLREMMARALGESDPR